MKPKPFILLWLSTLGFWCSVAALATLYPLYMESYGFAPGLIGMITGAAALGGLVVRPIVGWSVDRWGTRRFLLAGAAIWFITAPLVLLTSSAGTLFGYRLVQGVGGALFTAAALGYVGFVTPFALRGRTISWWDTSGSAANLLAPIIAAALVTGFGFLPAFWAAGLMGLFGCVFAFMLPTVVPGSAASKGALHYRLFTRSALGPGVFAVMVGVASGGLLGLAPLIGQAFSLKNVGLITMMFSLGTLAVRPLSAPLSDRRGRGWVILPGLGFMGAALLLIGFSDHPWIAFIAPFLFGFGLGSVVPGLMAMCVDGSPAEQRGTAGNTFYTFWELGFFVGASLQGLLYGVMGLSSFAWIGMLTILTLLGFAVYLKLNPGQPAPSAPDILPTENPGEISIS